MTDLPVGWAEARLADVAEVRLGRQRSPSRATGERMRPYLQAANVNWSGLALTDVKEMAFTEAESKVYELQPGDILLGEASGSPAEVGKPGQYKGEVAGCCFQNTLLRVRVPKELDSDFYELFFRKEALTGRFAAGSRGVGIHHLGAAALTNWTIPVPPRAEQERIARAVEEAFSKLDAGEAALRATRQRLKRLRESVLAAAVTGRLVPQDPADEPASKLLAGHSGSLVNLDSRGLPASWCLSNIGLVCRVAVGSTPSRKEPRLWGGGISWVSSSEVSFNRIRSTRETISEEALGGRIGRVHPSGTVMLAMIGEGKTRGQPAILEIPAAHNQNCASIRVEGSAVTSTCSTPFSLPATSRREELALVTISRPLISGS